MDQSSDPLTRRGGNHHKYDHKVQNLKQCVGSATNDGSMWDKH